MANNAPRGGLSPVKMANGQDYHGIGRPYYHAPLDSVALGIGDAVVKTGTSNLVAIVPSGGRVLGAMEFPIGSLPTVAKVTNGDNNKITGVVVAVGMDPAGSGAGPMYCPASTAAVVWVEDDPNVIFEIQSDGAASLHAAGNIGTNANLTGSTPNASTGRSSSKLDSSSMTNSATYQLTIEGVSRDLNRSDFASSGPSFYVRINNHSEAPNLAGI